MLITKSFTFDAAHKLIHYDGKCENLHGHTYKLQVSLKGEPDEDGMLIDFTELKAIVEERVLDVLDHAYINDVIEQSTSENIAVWIWGRLENAFKRGNIELYEITLYETADSSVTYRG